MLSFIQLTQPVPAPDTAPTVDLLPLIDNLIKAWSGGAYVMVVALIVGALIAVAKQGWASAWLAGHLPSKVLPFIAMLLGVLATATTEIQAGVPWMTALLHGILAGGLATAGHQGIIEGLRNGKEIVPATEKVKAQTIPPPPPSSSEVAISYRPTPPPPRLPTLMLRVATRALAFVLIASVVSLGAPGCSPAQWQNVETVAKDFISYVNLFLPAIEAVWSTILPTLGPKAAAANDEFNKAVVDVTNSLGALMDAIHVADSIGQPAPDIAALLASVKDAVARVMIIVSQYKTAAPQSPTLGAQADRVAIMAQKIAAWR
jgi:hypothetical protein